MESISEQLADMVEEEKLFKSDKLFKCILGLNSIESNVFSYLLKHDNVTTTELKTTFSKDRSSIQRALQLLIEREVIERKSMSLKDFSKQKGKNDKDKRGYLYVYGAKDLKYVKQQFRGLLEEWYNKMQIYIENLEKTFDCFEEEGELC